MLRKLLHSALLVATYTYVVDLLMPAHAVTPASLFPTIFALTLGYATTALFPFRWRVTI